MKNRADNVRGWTMEELTLILLRQFKRLLAERGADLTDAQMRDLARAVAEKHLETVGELGPLVLRALNQITSESAALLREWGLSFEQSLQTPMTDMPGWDSTADFLALANEKVNAELRISAGSALELLLGKTEALRHVLTTAKHGARDAEDVDAVIALRTMAHILDLDPGDSGAVLRAAEGWIDASDR